MSIGSRIKELRENKNISRIEFATMIGVTVGAVSNYENDVSSPKEPILFKIIEALDCDANYLFQDVVKNKEMTADVSLAEYDMIKKYRELTLRGKELVLSTIEREYEYAMEEIFIPAYPESIRMTRSELDRKKADGQLSIFELAHDFNTNKIKAAHNNHESEPGELENMREDIANLKRPE